jgi:uncharacterized protein YbaP (TraB family)
MNENHQRHILTTFHYVDRLLSETERILNSAGSPSQFQEYTQNSTPAQRKAAHEHILSLRKAMQQALDDLKIPVNQPGISALWAAHNHLAFASLAVAEIRSKQMEGYGAVSDDEKKIFDKISDELRERLDCLADYFAKAKDVDLPQIHR